MNNNLNNARLLPFTVIQKAAGGDVEAICSFQRAASQQQAYG